MAKYLSVYESNSTQYLNLSVDEFRMITILALDAGVKILLPEGRGYTLTFNIAGDAAGTKSIREYIQSNIMELINSSATTTVLQLPKQLPFILTDGILTAYAEIATIEYN